MEVSRLFSAESVAELSRLGAAAGGSPMFASCPREGGGLFGPPLASAQEIGGLFVGGSEGAAVVVSFRRFPFVPDGGGMAAASECVSRGLGLVVADFAEGECSVVVDCPRPEEAVPVTADECAMLLSKGGPLSLLFDGFEERPGQVALVRDVAETFLRGGVGVFEAGTGVGKSFAYLVPSILWAVRNRERVVVSTGTINLQQQLVEKDIPLARKVLGVEFGAVLVKGRANYVCLRRLAEVAESRELFGEDTEAFDRLYAWSRKTATGDRSDLPVQPREGLWQRVCSESDACMGGRCRFFDKCFVMKMRRAAAEADILVVNHHLLFADVASRMDGAGFDGPAVLPAYRRVVFDEAHGIEPSATSFFGGCVHRFRVRKQLSLLCKRFRGGAKGFVFTLSALSSGEDRSAEVEEAVDAAVRAFGDLESAADVFLGRENSARISASNAAAFGPVLERMEAVRSGLAGIAAAVRSIMDGIDEAECDEPVVWESKGVLRRLDSFASVLANYAGRESHPELVFWIQRVRLHESSPQDGGLPFYVQFHQTPLDVSPLMDEGVFAPMASVVCTSATLSIAGDFSFWEGRAGVSRVEGKEVVRGSFESPFQYRRNAILAVPSDAPFPDSPDFQPFVEDAVARLVLGAGGRTLVLFTSFEMLRRTADAVRKPLSKAGIPLLRQGDDDRFRLLTAFRDDERSVLFATDSFWEGVDVPGRSLSQVVIVKLPFSVPSDPVFAARSEILQAAGRSPFMELSVPEAVIRFRQGFGRLIRRGDDRGAVVVLDRRVIEKRYGSMFLQSVPRTARSYKPLGDLLADLRPFL